LRFAEAGDRWLAEQVSELRTATQASYSNSFRIHLEPRWGRKRLDQIDVTDVVRLVRELRANGKAETTIQTILRAASRIFKFARRHLCWYGSNPVPLLEPGERPRASYASRRRLYTDTELPQTLAAANEPHRTALALLAVTGCRESEALGLVWSDLDLSDPSDASVSFVCQLSRKGRREPLKTDDSRRRNELTGDVAVALLELRARSPHCGPSSFVFATRSGRAIGQRNFLRELRRAMTNATDIKGRPTFPALHQGRSVKRGELPDCHALRHTHVSTAIAAGESVEELSWQIGHKNSVVTRTVYLQEIRTAERTARRRARMEVRYGTLHGSAVEAADRSRERSDEASRTAQVVPLARVRGGGQEVARGGSRSQ